MKNWIGVFAFAFTVSGCAQGGLLGMSSNAALEPTQFASSGDGGTKAVAGVAGGGLIGGELGADLSRKEHLFGLEAEYRALETTPAGRPVRWQNDRTGNGGTVVAAQPYRVGSQDCRQYSHTVSIHGVQRSARGTACRNDDGSWIVLN